MARSRRARQIPASMIPTNVFAKGTNVPAHRQKRRMHAELAERAGGKNVSMSERATLPRELGNAARSLSLPMSGNV